MNVCETCGGKGRIYEYRGPRPCPRCQGGANRQQAAMIRLMNVDDITTSEKNLHNLIKAAYREGVDPEIIAKILNMSHSEVIQIVA